MVNRLDDLPKKVTQLHVSTIENALTSATLNHAINYLESVYYEGKQEDKTLT